jgi:hypothetical protein
MTLTKIILSIDGKTIDLSFEKRVNIIDVIIEIDRKKGKNRYNLLHSLYNPRENRFYNQIGINAYTNTGEYLNLRQAPLQMLPFQSKLYILTKGPCISDFDEVIPYEEFVELVNNKRQES